MAFPPLHHLLLVMPVLLAMLPAGLTSRRHLDKEAVRFSPESRMTCVYENVTYIAGRRFQPDPCTFCQCPHTGGRVRCAIQDCYRQPSCVRYDKRDDECCGVCVEFGCLHSDGKSYPPGATIRTSACDTCRCPPSGGRTVCERVPCPPSACVNPIKEKAACCLTCPTGDNCWLDKRVIPAGLKVRMPGCKECYCPEPTSRPWATTTFGRSHQPRAVCAIRKGCH